MRVLWLAGIAALLAGQPAPPPPVPTSALEGVIGALRANQLVAISDPHGSATAQTFIRRLIADPRFPDLVRRIGTEPFREHVYGAHQASKARNRQLATA